MNKLKLSTSTIIAIFLVLVVFTSTFIVLSNKDIKERFNSVSTFNIYLNTPTKEIVNKMGEYDLVVINPLLYTKETVKEIHSKGTILLGRVDTVLGQDLGKEEQAKITESDILKMNGEKVKCEFGNDLLDISSQNYSSILLGKIEKEIVGKGLDGVYFDNLVLLEIKLGGNQQELESKQKAVEQFFMLLKNKYPKLLIVQGGGFGTLENFTGKVVDGYAWFGFESKLVDKELWAQQQVQTLNKLMSTNSLKVFVVSSKDKEINLEATKKNGFIYLYKDKPLHEW